MVTRLGETDDPLALIPGNPASIARVAGQLYGYSTVLAEAGDGLKRIDTTTAGRARRVMRSASASTASRSGG